jgi:hypothetical protein
MFDPSEEYCMKRLVLSAAAVVALSAAGVAFAAGPSLSKSGVPAAPVKGSMLAGVLYDQSANDSGIGIVSQNFEASFDVYDAQAADDFTVPSGKTWKVTEVDALGVYFNGSGPAASEHVTIYKNKGGKPGAVVADYPALTGTDNFGSFAIKLPKALKLKNGTYWVSVQANMDFGAGGEWGWENQTTVEGKAAVWQNPGDGFGTGCTSYTTESVCIPDGQGDHMFILKGKSN